MDLVIRALPDFLIGTRNTLIYCVVSFVLALILGLLLALMRNSRFVWLRAPSSVFIEVMRGTPIITQLLLLYYGIGAVLLNITLFNVNLAFLDNSWTAGIAALALNYAAYEAEVYRAGFLSVDRGQTEAALSLGLTDRQSFLRVLLPQAVPLMIPPFVNDFIYMLKDSAVISVISGADLTASLNFWVSRNGSNPFLLYALALGLYLVLSLPTSYVARRFETRLRAAL